MYVLSPYLQIEYTSNFKGSPNPQCFYYPWLWRSLHMAVHMESYLHILLDSATSPRVRKLQCWISSSIFNAPGPSSVRDSCELGTRKLHFTKSRAKYSVHLWLIFAVERNIFTLVKFCPIWVNILIVRHVMSSSSKEQRLLLWHHLVDFNDL